jgi:hypothetical protein
VLHEEKKPIMTRKVVPTLLAVALLGGCAELMDFALPEEQQGRPAAERIAIQNDEATLRNRVTLVDREVKIFPSGPSARKPAAGDAPLLERHSAGRAVLRVVGRLLELSSFGFFAEVQKAYSGGSGGSPALATCAEVEPPATGGKQNGGGQGPAGVGVVALQATGIALSNNTAVVSYSRVGDVYAGAVDLFDISDPFTPRLKSHATFDCMDVNAVALNVDSTGTGNLYLVGATCDPTFAPHTAAMERMTVTKHKLSLDGSQRFHLSGFVGTGVAIANGIVYATSGTEGGIVAFDATTHERLAEISLADARWVAAGGGIVCVVEAGCSTGGPNRLTILSSDLGLIGSVPFSATNILRSKGTVEIIGHHAFVAAGNEGVVVINLITGAVVESLPLPAEAKHRDPEEALTNAVSVDGRLLFLANGGLGVYVAQAPVDLASWEDDDAALTLEILGFLDLDGSANHVVFHGNLLFVAGGSVGLQVIRVNDLLGAGDDSSD